MGSSSFEKSWKESTLVFIEFKGLLGVSSPPPKSQNLFFQMEEKLQELSEKFSGEVHEFLGSEAVLVFGINQFSHHTHRALSAVWEFKAFCESFAPFTFVAGVHLGSGVLGERGEDRVALWGSTLQKARDLAPKAPWGNIVVSTAVEEVVRKRFLFTPHPSSEPCFLLKGIPIDTSEFAQEISIHEKIFFQIQGLLPGLLEGGKKWVSLPGESGLGKSFFLKRMHQNLLACQISSFLIKCQPSSTTYTLFRQIWKKILRIKSAASFSAQSKERLSHFSPLEKSFLKAFLWEGKEPRFPLLESLEKSLSPAPCAILLDDFDLAPPFDRDLLLQWFGRSSRALLILSTHTQPLDSFPSSEFLQIPFSSLSKEEMSSLLQSKVAECGLPPSLLSTLVENSQGNPGLAFSFLEEASQNFNLPLSLPPRGKQILLGRFQSLSEGDQKIVQKASICGKAFSLSLLASLLKTTESLLLPMITSFQEKKIFREGKKKIHFASPYLHQVIYETLFQEERISLHREVSLLLEKQDWGGKPLLKIYQYYQSGWREKALLSALEEAKKLSQRKKNHEAFWILEESKKMLQPLSPEEERQWKGLWSHLQERG